VKVLGIKSYRIPPSLGRFQNLDSSGQVKLSFLFFSFLFFLFLFLFFSFLFFSFLFFSFLFFSSKREWRTKIIAEPRKRKRA